MAQPATNFVDESRERIHSARERIDSEFKKAQKDLDARRKRLEKQLTKNRKSFEKEFVQSPIFYFWAQQVLVKQSWPKL